MIKKVVILSDTHGFIHPEIIDLVNKYDIAIHAGDVCVASTLNKLKPLEKLIVIAGNNDDHIALNQNTILDLYGEQIAIEHGHLHGHIQPSHDSLRSKYPNAKIIIYGHTHKQIIDNTQNPWVINPGAAGKIRTHGGASCLVLTANSNKDWSIEKLRFID